MIRLNLAKKERLLRQTSLYCCSQKDPKFAYYLSAEFLMGRSLTNTVYNLGLDGEYGKALQVML